MPFLADGLTDCCTVAGSTMTKMNKKIHKEDQGDGIF